MPISNVRIDVNAAASNTCSLERSIWSWANAYKVSASIFALNELGVLSLVASEFLTPAQIAAHNSRGNCWVYLSQINKAYNITSYVANPSLHPGGDVIAPHCGTDIYNYFLGTAGGHKHSANALNNVLQAYYIGPMS